VPVFRLKVAPKGTNASTTFMRSNRSSTTAPQRLAQRRATSNIWSSGLGSTAPIRLGSPATRSSKEPSTLLVTIGQRDHRRHRPARHDRADSARKIGEWTRYELASSTTSLSHTTRGMGLGWMAGLARLVWGLGYLQTVPVVFM